MEDWPGNLGTKWPAEGFKYTVPENTIRTRTVSGRLKSYRRFTQPREVFEVTWVWDQTQFDIFIEFYNTTLKYGSVSFQGLPHPFTEVNSVWMFLSDPDITPYQSGGFFMAVTCRLQHQPDTPI